MSMSSYEASYLIRTPCIRADVRTERARATRQKAPRVAGQARRLGPAAGGACPRNPRAARPAGVRRGGLWTALTAPATRTRQDLEGSCRQFVLTLGVDP